MKSYKVAVIPGDGIGVEVVKSSIDVLNALQEDKNFKLEFEEFDWSSEYYFKHGKMMPEDGIKQLEDLGATEVIVAFRNAYEGGPDNRTIDGMIAEINWYAEEVINKVK